MKIFYDELPELLTTYLMFSGELCFGLGYYLYKYLSNNKTSSPEKKPKFIGISLISREVNEKDSGFKVIFYIIIAAILDFTYFVVLNYILPLITLSINDQSQNSFLATKLKPMQIIFSSIICYYFLKKAIYLHHIFSLVIIILSSLGITFTEIFVVVKEIVIIIFFIMLVDFLITCSAECLEKYLMDLYSCSIFKLLVIEGISGIILTIILNFIIKLLSIDKSNKSISPLYCCNNIYILIITSIFYFLLSGLYNSYRLTVIMKLSPMSTYTCDSVVDPLIIIYSFFNENGKNKKNNLYIIINIIIASIIIFCCLVYNEILILRCCDLDKNTYAEIVFRSYSEDLLNYDYRPTADNEDPIYNLGDENDE